MKTKHYAFLTLALTCLPVFGQEKINLNDPSLKGLQLEFIKNDGSYSTGKWADQVSVYSDITYWNFFASRTVGWNGGDGVYTTALPDGNTFWSFGDSFFGLVSEFRNRKAPNNFPRNAAMIQTGEKSIEDFITLNEYISTDPNDREHYYKGKTWLRHPDASKTDAEINDGQTDSDWIYWPGDATVYTENGESILQMLVGGLDTSKGNMDRQETSLAEYYLEGNPKDPTSKYMKLKKLHKNIVKYTQGYGSGIWEDEDGHTYLYSNEGGFIFGGAYPIVARSKTHDLKSEWEYYIKDKSGNWSWQTTPPADKGTRQNSIISDDWCQNPNVFKYQDKYYLVCQDALDGGIYIAQADHPWGYFKKETRKQIYAIPKGQSSTYNVFLHPQFSRTGELVISYNMNPVTTYTYKKGDNGQAIEEKHDGFARNFNDWGSADLYQPHFIRVFNWQQLFGLSTSVNAQKTERQEKVYVYPTEVTDKLNIKTEDNNLFTWYLVDTAGSVVKTGSGEGHTEISMGALNKGIYLLRVNHNAGNTNEKIIKK